MKKNEKKQEKVDVQKIPDVDFDGICAGVAETLSLDLDFKGISKTMESQLNIFRSLDDIEFFCKDEYDFLRRKKNEMSWSSDVLDFLKERMQFSINTRNDRYASGFANLLVLSLVGLKECRDDGVDVNHCVRDAFSYFSDMKKNMQDKGVAL